MRVAQLYDLAVLWLLSAVARRTVETIYQHGHDDGENELRDYMRRELTAIQAANVADRMRAYNNGFADAMRLYGDTPREMPGERWVM